MNDIVRNLIQRRIDEIEYILDMNEIGRDILPNGKTVELIDERFALKAEVAPEDADEIDALMAIACR